MRLRNSFWVGLTQDENDASVTQLEPIRQAMFSAMDELSVSDVRMLEIMISDANDISGVWNLRSDLMNAISAEYGEEFALFRLEAVTDMLQKALR